MPDSALVCILHTDSEVIPWEQHSGSQDRVGISSGILLSATLQHQQLLCIFSLLSFTLFSLLLSDPFVFLSACSV